MLSNYSATHSSYGLSLKAFVVLVFSTSEYLRAVSILDDIVEILGCELSPVIPNIFPSDTLEPHFDE